MQYTKGLDLIANNGDINISAYGGGNIKIVEGQLINGLNNSPYITQAVLTSNYYTQDQCDDKFALKSENSGGSGNIDWSNINAETISITWE